MGAAAEGHRSGSVWRQWDSVYFFTVTMSTVGYGDIHPDTAGTQVFNIFMLVPGVVR